MAGRLKINLKDKVRHIKICWGDTNPTKSGQNFAYTILTFKS